MKTTIFQLKLRQHSTYQCNYSEIIPKSQNTRKESHRKKTHQSQIFIVDDSNRSKLFFQEEKERRKQNK